MKPDLIYIHEEIRAAIKYINEYEIKTALQVLKMVNYSIAKEIDKTTASAASELIGKLKQ